MAVTTCPRWREQWLPGFDPGSPEAEPKVETVSGWTSETVVRTTPKCPLERIADALERIADRRDASACAPCRERGVEPGSEWCWRCPHNYREWRAT